MFKLICVFLLTTFTACDLLKPANSSSKSVDELLSAPEKIVINEREYILETYMWRDFQPVSPPGGKPLIAIIRVTAVDSLSVPTEIDATRLWVIKEGKKWESAFTSEDRGYVPDHKLEKVARNGPKWGPGIHVDVVVRVIDRRDGGEYLLHASGQYIGKTM